MDVADSLQTASKKVVKARHVVVVVAAVVVVAVVVDVEGRAEVQHVAVVALHGAWAFHEVLDEGEDCGDAYEPNRPGPGTKLILWKSEKLNCLGLLLQNPVDCFEHPEIRN